MFIDLGLHCTKYIDFSEEEAKEYFNECLDLVFHRGELDLASIGFSQAKDLDSKIVKVKKSLAEDYRYLLYRTLQISIEKISRKSVDIYRQEFIAYSIALSFFRIPEFKQLFLELIQEKPFIEVDEWRDNVVSDPNQNEKSMG